MISDNVVELELGAEVLKAELWTLYLVWVWGVPVMHHCSLLRNPSLFRLPSKNTVTKDG